MQTGIHPESHSIKVSCSCGNELEVLSTVADDTKVEICSKCHPFYTGEQKILKTGAVDKFYARQKKMEELAKKK
jgi:large subunit ribosomal protein L31